MKFVLALVWILANSPLVMGAPPAFFEPLDPPRGFQVVLRQTASRPAPPNTKAAIALAIEDAVPWIEVDVRLTKDGRHVLAAGERLEAFTSGSGLLAERTLAELQTLDAGSWFARRFSSAKLVELSECFELAKGKINLCLRVAQADPRRLAEEIKSAGMERQVLVAGSVELLKAVRQQNETIAVMAPAERAAAFATLKPTVVEIDADRLDRQVVQGWHDKGAAVQASFSAATDQAKFWDQALAAGADRLCTAVPEELLAHAIAGKLPVRKTLLAAHRGASRYAPENTLPAFEKAARVRADYVEFDVRPTSDGLYYLLHDGALDRTTNGKGPIRQATSAQVNALDAGGWFARPYRDLRVPTLDEFLSAVPPGVSLYFDAKDIPPPALAAALAKHQLIERTLVYQSAQYLAELKQIDARIRRMPPASSIEQVSALAADLKPFAVDTPWRVLSQKYIDHCHAAGIQVFSDAPFYADVRGYQQAIAWGIDLIQTDYPLRYWRALELSASK